MSNGPAAAIIGPTLRLENYSVESDRIKVAGRKEAMAIAPNLQRIVKNAIRALVSSGDGKIQVTIVVEISPSNGSCFKPAQCLVSVCKDPHCAVYARGMKLRPGY